MTNYSDFLLNELVGTAGLDFQQTTEVLTLLDEKKEVADETQPS